MVMRLSHPTLLVVVLSLLPVSSLCAQGANGASGHWEGKIEIPNREMAVIVDLAKSATGAWVGTVSIPASTSIDVPLTDVVVQGATVRFTTTLPEKVSFEGTLSTDPVALAGTVTNPQGSVPFRLARNGDAILKLPPPSSPMVKAFNGRWEGTAAIGDKTLRLALELSAAPDGTAKGTLITVDQGNQEIPASTVLIKGSELQLELRAVSGSYRGTLSTAGEIAGEWLQGPTRIPLTFKHAAADAK
jgi:hypothetical protein